MRRRDKSGGKAVKLQRRKTLTRRSAPKAARGRNPAAADEEANVAGLTRALCDAREQQIATAEILRVIRASPADARPVFETIVRNAVSLCGGLFANVFSFDGELLHYVASHNVGPSYADLIRANYPRRPDASQVAGRVVLSKSVVWLEDAFADPNYDQRYPRAMGWRRLLGVPMLHDGEPIGAISVGWVEPGPASKVQEELLKTFADQAVIAIENARLLNELHQRTNDLSESLEQQTATSKVLGIISSSPGELEPVFNAMLENAVRICAAKFGSLVFFEGDAYRRGAPFKAPAALLEQQAKNPVRPLSASPFLTRMAGTKKVVQVTDMLVEQPDEAIVKFGGARTVLSVPMLRNNQTAGVFTIYRQEVRPFTEKQIELVKNFAAQAVIAIENTRLLNELRQRTDDLSESLEQQTATSEVLQVISESAGELQPVFNAMLENAVRICDAKFGNLFVREGDTFRISATHGAPPAYLEFLNKERVFRLDPKYGLGQLVKTKQLYNLADISTVITYGDKLREATIHLAGARSLIALPMLKDDEVIGAIVIYRQEVRPFTEKQIELVQNFAAQAVIAIENARLLNELRESLQQQTATADVLKVISRSTFDLQTVLNTLVESVTHLCDAKDAFIFLRKDQLYHVAARYGFSHKFHEFLVENPRPATRGSITGRTALEAKVVHVHDVMADPEYNWSQAQQLGGYRTVLGVPLLRDGVPIGVIIVGRTFVQPFTDKQIELVTTFADQAVIAIENVRLFDEVQARTRELSESLEQQTATSEILQVISNSPTDTQPAFDAIVRSGLKLFPDAVVAISLPDRDLVRLAAIGGADEAGLEALRGRYPMPLSHEFITGTAILDRCEIDLADAHEPPKELTVGAQNLLAGGYSAMTVMPMTRGDETIGSLNVVRRRPGHLSDKQRELLRTFANQAVIAIENTRLFNELRQRTDDLIESLEQQTATSEVLKVISSTPGELKPVFDAMLANATRICDASFGNLVIIQDEIPKVVAMHGAPRAFQELRRDDPRVQYGSPVWDVVKDKSIIHIPDIAATENYASAAIATHAGARTFLGVPMLKGNNLVGTISIYRQEVRPFSNKQIDLVKNFAAQAVIAIENTRLLSELRESLQQQTATADVLKVISRSTFDLQTVLDALTESAARLCEADQSFLLRPEGNTYIWAANYGFTQEFVEFRKKRPIRADNRGSLVGRAVVEGKIVHIPDVLEDPEYTNWEAQKIAGFRTVLGVPLLREGDSIGVFTLARLKPRPFSDKQIELLTTFADQAAIAIENVRLFESVEARTRELAKSLEDLRTTQDRLVQTQKLASLGQLTAGIAHEIKNPLNFVNNFSGVSSELIDELQDALKVLPIDQKACAEINELTDTLRGNLDKVVQHGKRADAIVKNMLLHSREGSGEHRVVDINALVEESLNLAYHGARAEKQGFNITLERSLDPAAGQADVFPQDITRVLLNLISNGFYAATKRRAEADGNGYEPTLVASTRSLGDRVEIRVRDNGTGIPSEVKEKMFNPFFTTKPAGEGTGLGLSICHDIIVKQHGGSIEVGTQLGQFTEVTVILPRAAVFV